MPSPINQDLFEHSTMTFGEHLEELRGALFRSLIGLTIGFLVACYVANSVVQWIQVPLMRALENYYRQSAVDEIEAKYGGELPPEVQRMVDAGYAPDSSVMIEPISLLDQLQRDYPGQFNFKLSRHIFTPKDLVVTESYVGGTQEVDKTIALAQRWRDAGTQAAPTPGKELWKRLSASQREQVEKIAALKQPDAKARAALVLLLNDLIAEPDLHATKAFDGIQTSGDALVVGALEELRAKRATNKGKLELEDAQRLNQFLIAAYFSDTLRPPSVNVVEMSTWKRIRVRTIALNAQEAFMIWVKAALVTGAVLASPYVFIQIWMFVAAGLYPHEKNYVYLYLPISLGLFLAGAALAFFFVFDPVLNFLFTFNRAMKIDPDPRIGEWLGFVLFLPLGFGVSFQLPLVMLFLNRIGVVPLTMFIEKWRIAILIIFVVSMVLTPADPISMLLMAIPLCVLYFGGILMCKYMPRSRNPFDEGYEPS